MRQILTLPVILVLLVPLAQAIARTASAEEPAKPWRALFDRSQKLSNEGEYSAALVACEQAYEANPDPGLLIYIAQIQIALLHPVQARDALQRYLRSGPIDDAKRQMAEGQIRYLETLIAKLVITTALEGAEIRIDDEVMDLRALAQGVDLRAGAHRVTLQAKQATFRRDIFLRAGERGQIDLPGNGVIALSCATPQVRFFIDDRELSAVEASRGLPQPAGTHRVTFKAGAPPWFEQQVVVTAEERVTVVCIQPPAAPAARPAMNPRGYWITGVGLALGGAALATAIYNGSEYNRWQTANDSLKNSLRHDDLGLAEGANQAEQNNQLMDTIETRRKVALGLGIAGGLVTAGGVALLFFDSAAPAQNRASSWLRKVATGVTFNGAASSGEIAWRGAW